MFFKPFWEKANVVSIQLVSPASGENLAKNDVKIDEVVSIQLVSPASGESSTLNLIQRKMSRGSLRGSGIIVKHPTVTHP